MDLKCNKKKNFRIMFSGERHSVKLLSISRSEKKRWGSKGFNILEPVRWD